MLSYCWQIKNIISPFVYIMMKVSISFCSLWFVVRLEYEINVCFCCARNLGPFRACITCWLGWVRVSYENYPITFLIKSHHPVQLNCPCLYWIVLLDASNTNLNHFPLVDINECINEDLSLRCTHECQDTIGSYECICPEGLQLSIDTFTCTGEWILEF